ncbi:MAG: FAD-dependent oxidoreductase [Clostridia bacterium]|nr:FAD-dependent oxidoreductase [Clostridia bacterium]
MRKYDLIVVGGGLTGVAAAVSAAREGLSVLLIEKSGALGGALNTNLVYPFMRYWTYKEDKKIPQKILSAGIFGEMVEREHQRSGNTDRTHFKPEYFKLILDEMVEEARVEVLFHTTLFAVCTEGRQVVAIRAAAASGALTLEADAFIDATGNGDLMALAGCDFQLGRERDGLCQPMTTCFRMSGVDLEQFKQDIAMLQEKYKELQAAGEIQNPRENILYFFQLGEGIVHFNTTRIIKHDPTDPLAKSKAEMLARKQIFEMERFLKEHSKAFENATICSVATEIGIRESRKLKGEYILTVEDLKDLVDFEDAIALGNYDVDIHSPDGSGTSHYYFRDGKYYKIPYRALLPKEFDNLLVAGRCISATHEAQASIRIMPICATLGQAAGTALAIARKTGTNARTVDVKALRQKLLEQGASL